MKPTMLVVDDEALVRMDLAATAQEVGFQTVEAGNAARALKVLEGRDDIRVVFTDIRMPGEIDGLRLAHIVRTRWPPTVIVICSGNNRPSDGELPPNVVFMSKPCTGPKLNALLASILADMLRDSPDDAPGA